MSKELTDTSIMLAKKATKLLTGFKKDNT